MNPEAPANTDDDLYDTFVERFHEEGVREIPASWSADLRERCQFFLDVLSVAGASISGSSVVAALTATELLPEDEEQPGGSVGRDAAPAPSNERYRVEREIAAGGMGRILLCYDRDFRRRIAMKIIKNDARNPVATERFVEEAQATAQLEHPNINPVYDMGLDLGGSPYFTMKWIRGRNLQEIIATPPEDMSLTRQVQLLQQVAMAIEFAHSRGVVHRDLKPQNIMVGDFGEVLVVDWGIAKVLGQSRTVTGESDTETVITERVERLEETRPGTMQGSLLYMAPEQARGDPEAIEARTDVFGLGAILYEILTGGPPYDRGTFGEVLAQIRWGSITPPSARAPERSVPPELEEICCRALADERADRYPSARAFHDALQHYVEGVHDRARREAEAARLLAAAELTRLEWRAAEATEHALRTEEAALRRAVLEQAPTEERDRLWALVDRRRTQADLAARLFGETTSALASVLNVEPDHAVARNTLADLWFTRLVAAEERGDPEAARLYEGLVSSYQGEEDRHALHGLESVSLDSTPRGAHVCLRSIEPRGARLVEGAVVAEGKTPVHWKLPRGSFLATVTLEGHTELRYPIFVKRDEHIDARMSLYPLGAIPSGFVQIPAGRSIVGGDPTLTSALSRESLEVREFFVGRFPVTLAEYCEFLDDQLGPETEEGEDSDKLLPASAYQSFVERTSEGAWRPRAELSGDVPVMAVHGGAARAYCAWLSRRLDRPVRLLGELEWERCARGADGRLFPWGNEFDWSLCHGAPSRDRRPLPEPVGSFPGDVSPFGVRDLAGCVRELCSGGKNTEDLPTRGGSWFQSLPIVFRTDTRSSVPAAYRTTDIGFRVAFSMPREPA